jgi:hypothetical protein
MDMELAFSPYETNIEEYMHLRESNRIMDWRKLRYKTLHHSYSSADIFSAQNQGLWKRHERRTRKARTKHTLLVVKKLSESN